MAQRPVGLQCRPQKAAWDDRERAVRFSTVNRVEDQLAMLMVCISMVLWACVFHVCLVRKAGSITSTGGFLTNVGCFSLQFVFDYLDLKKSCGVCV